jgi:hypothetical protein
MLRPSVAVISAHKCLVPKADSKRRIKLPRQLIYYDNLYQNDIQYTFLENILAQKD